MADPIDARTFEEIRSLDEDPKEIRKLVDLFISNADSLLSQLVRHVREGETDEVLRIAHQLKSTCASIGALRLAEEFKKLESEASHASSRLHERQLVIEEEYRHARTRLLELVEAEG